MIRSCAKCSTLHDVDGVEDQRVWVCVPCHRAGWRVDTFGNLYRVTGARG